MAARDEVQAWAERVAAGHGKVNLVRSTMPRSPCRRCWKASSPRTSRWIMDINFWGVVWGTQAFLPHLRLPARARGQHVEPVRLTGAGNGAYNASKFAVRGYTEALRMELELSGIPVSDLRASRRRADQHCPGGAHRSACPDAEWHVGRGGRRALRQDARRDQPGQGGSADFARRRAEPAPRPGASTPGFSTSWCACWAPGISRWSACTSHGGCAARAADPSSSRHCSA